MLKCSVTIAEVEILHKVRVLSCQLHSICLNILFVKRIMHYLFLQVIILALMLYISFY